jgi:23S rRNA (uracil1939-C5)-methyltransferase
MAPDEAVSATVHDLSHDGRGVADIGGKRVFVSGALPSERVLLSPRRRRRSFQEAELVDVVEPSIERVTPACEYFGVCGGCALQHLAYDAQVRFKQNVVAEALRRIAGIEPDVWRLPITGPQWGYRRRARLGVKFVTGKDRVLVGFRERAAPYVTDMGRCPVLAAPVGEALADLAAIIAGTTIRQRVPQAEVAIGENVSAIVLRVLDAPSAADIEAFRAFGRRHGIQIYLQPGGPGTVASIDAPAETLCYTLPEFGLRLEFEPTDFVQINAHVNAAMVSAAVELAGIEPVDRVLDLYCGLGNFSLPIARRAHAVLGIEGDAGLVARAARNAEINGIGNARFAAADLSLSDWRFFREQHDIVMLDPARTGAEAAVESMDRMGPRRVVYVSCHPATLARDACVLVRCGYRLTTAGILDMFPHTHHVEAIAVFDRAS